MRQRALHSAGPSVGRRTLTAEGLELMFAAQYLARFQLTKELLPLLAATASSRIISIAGGGLAKREVAYDNLNSEKGFSALGAVLQTSVANDLLGVEVNQRQHRVRMSVYGPGMVKGTGLSSGFSAPMRAMFSAVGMLMGRTPDDAAQDLVRLVREDLPGGLYQAKLKAVQPNAYVSQQAARTRLWEASERAVAQALAA